MSARSPDPIIDFRATESASRWRRFSASTSRARSTAIALALFLCWLFSSWISTTRPDRKVGDPDRRVRGVHGLAARPGGALDLDSEVALLVDLDLVGLDLGQDDDGRGRGVDPPRRFRGRHPLHAMRAALELEPRVRTIAADLDDRLLDSADAGFVKAHDLGRVAVTFGVAQVHPEELGGEQGGLLAAGTGPDLEDHVAVVGGITGQEEDLELLDEPGFVGLEPVDLLAGHGPHLLVALAVPELAGAQQLGSRVEEAAIRLDHGFEAGELATEPPDRLDVGARLGKDELGLDLVVLGRDLGQLVVELAHAGTGAGAHRLERGPLGLVRASRHGLAVGAEGLLDRDDRDLDLVVGWLLRGDLLDQDPGPHDRRHDGVAPVPRAPVAGPRSRPRRGPG